MNIINTKEGLNENKWIVGNKDILVTVELIQGQLMWNLSGTQVGMDLKNAPLGIVSVQGHELKWEHVISVFEEKNLDGSQTLTLILQDEMKVISLSQYITIFTDHPFVRIWGELENIGDEPTIISDCRIFSLTPVCNLPLALFHVEQCSASYQHDFFRPQTIRLIVGRTPHNINMGSYPSQYLQPTSCAWFALLSDNKSWCNEVQPSDGEGLVCGIEFNGKSTLNAYASTEDANIVSSIDNLAHKLLPSGKFEIPAFFIGRFEGDWDEAGYVTQRFAEKHVHPPMPDNNYPWAQYNSWAYGEEINESQQLAAIERCATLGIELVVLDLGWARTVGDWRPDHVKFPRGLKPLVEKAKSYGMRFGVHVALAQCNVNAPIAKEHPEWLIQTDTDYFGAASICLGNEPCREWLIDQLSLLVENEGIDYIIQDGEDMVKYCTHSDHTHNVGDSNYSNSQYGLDKVIEGLREKQPQLVLENCEDGGCMMTYKMARMYHTSITVDNIDTYSTRQGIYGASYPFSPRYSVRYMQDDPTHYTLYSAIFGGPLIFMQRITQWNDEQLAETRRAVEKYKSIRKIVKDAKIIHLQRPQYNVGGIGYGWDAIQAVSQDQTKSIVMIYRSSGDSIEKTFKPRGLKQDAIYNVRLDSQTETRSMSGMQLQNDGIAIQLEEFGAEMLIIEII